MKKNILKRLYIKLSNVTELKYSIPLDIKNMRNLIVAPHPDDELFGCFGVLNDHSCHNDILLITDGEKGISDLSEEETRLVRNKEFMECCSNLNVANIEFSHLPDSNLNLKIMNENIETEKLKYDNIFLPNILDLHPDHYMCSRFFLGAKSLKNTNIYFYEVWSALPVPSHHINISECADKKRKLINIYDSQIKYVDYANKILGLNAYRAMTNNGSYCEAFYKVSKNLRKELL